MRKSVLALTVSFCLMAGVALTSRRGRTSSRLSRAEFEPVLVPLRRLGNVRAPPERVIEFYHVSGNDSSPVCRILVKYRQTADGWRPAYMLNNPPPVMWDGHKLVPLDTRPRVPVQVVGGSGADGNGFYTRLSLGSPTGAFPIDAWQVY